MATLDISVVNIALPTLARSFGVALPGIEWAVLAYVVTITALLLVLGRISDRVGRRRVYGAGLIVFTLASALCAAAPSAALLIAARAVQGLGAAMMTANSAALLVAGFPEQERGKALGAFGAMVGVGLALGPPLGGLLVRASWRWIFLINLPLGALALWRLHAGVPPDRIEAPRGRLGLPGAALGCATLVLVMLGLSRGPVRGWGSPTVWPLFAVAGVLAAAFVLAERGRPQPLLPFARLRGPLANAVLLTLTGQMLSIAVGFHLPHYLEEVLHFDGPRRVATLGLMIAAPGFWLLSGLGLTPDPPRLYGAMALLGTGLGLFTVPNASAVMSAVPREELGLASGLQGTMRNLGIAAGAAGMAALVASRYAAHGGGPLTASEGPRFSPLAFTLASREAYLAVLALAVVSMGLSWPRGESSTAQTRSGSAFRSAGRGS